MGGINFVSTLDNSDFIKGMEQMRSSLSSVSAAADSQGGAIEAAMGRAARAAAAFGVGFSAVGFVKRVAAVRGEFQQLESSFRTLLGNEQKAADLMEQLTRTAAITPFDLKGVANGAKNLLAYGVEADKVNDKILQLGNLASGLSLNLNDVITLYGTTVSKDAMDTLDVKQFQNRGIAIKQAIADVMRLDEKDGSISAQVDALVTAKKVTPEIFEAAIASMAGASGQFAGMMENQSKTIAGQISNIGDAVDSMFNNIGKQSEGVISGTLDGVSYVVENYEEVGKAIAEVVAAYGVYKGVLMSVAAFQSAGARMEIEGLEGLLGALDETADAETAELARKRGLSAEDAERLAHLRAEARQRLALAEAATAQAAQEKAAAARSVAAEDAKLGALRRTEAAMRKHLATREAQLAAERATLTAGQQAARQRELDAIRAQLATNAEAQNTAARARNAAAAAEQAAATRQAAAARQRDTIQAGINTAAVNANSKAAGLLAKAQAALGKAMKSTGLASLANPYVLAAAAVAGLAYGIYKLVTYESDLEKAQRRVNEVFDDATMGAAEEMARLHELTAQMERAEEGSDEYNAARQRIIDQFGQYREGLEGEIGQLTTQSELYRELTAAILDHYMQKAKAQASDEANSKFGETVKEQLKDIKETFDDLQKEEEEGAKRDARALAAIKERYRASYAAVRDAIIKGGLEIDEATGRLRGADIDEGIQEKLVKRISYETGEGTGKEYHNYNTNELVGELAAIREARKLRDATMEEVNAIYGMSAPAKDKGATGAEAAAKAATEADRKAVAARYKGLRELVKKIEEQERKLKETRAKARRGETYEQTIGGKTTVMTYTDEEVKAESDKLDTLTKAYKELTRTTWEGRAERARAVKEAQDDADEALAEAARRQETQERERAEREQAMEMELLEDSLAKRMAARKAGYEKEIGQIREQGEAEKRELVAQAKERHDAEEKVRAARAKADGRDYAERGFDKAGYRESDEYKAAAEAIDRRTEKTVDLRRSVQRKQEREALKSDLEWRQEYYQKYIDLEARHQQRLKDIEDKRRAGALSDAQAAQMTDIANRQSEREKTAAGYTDETLGQDVGDIEEAARRIVEGNLERLLELVEEVEAAISEAESGGDGERAARLRAQAAALSRQVASQAEGEAPAPGRQAMERWEDYREVISGSIDVLSGLGDAADETTRRIVQSATDIANSTLQIVNTIVSFVSKSIDATKVASQTGAEAVKAVEKASVILAVIAAVIEITTKLANLLGGKDKAFEEYEELAAKQREVNSLRDAVDAYTTAVMEARHAEEGWLRETAGASLRQNWEAAQDAMRRYDNTLNERQAAYQDQKGGGGGFWKAAALITGIGADFAVNSIRKENSERYDGGLTTAINNLRFETRSARKGNMFKKGRDQKTVDLRQWAKENLGVDLFDPATQALNVEAAETIIDRYGDKLVGETKETLQKLVDQQKAYDEAMGALKEQTSEWFAPLFDNMADALWDWVGEGKDALDAFGDYASETFADVAKELLSTVVQRQVMGTFDDDLAALTEKYAKGDLDEKGYYDAALGLYGQVRERFAAQKDDLQGFVAGLQEQARAEGLDLTGQAADQEATYGGYETMSEETGSELSGRFSAMYIVQSEHLSTARLMSEQMASVCGLLAAGGGALSDIRALHARANDHLASLVKIAGAIAAWGETIEGIERHTRTLE